MKLQNHAFVTEGKQVLRVSFMILTDNIFETGAYQVLSKSQNPTVLGQGGPSSTQCSHPKIWIL